MLHYHWHDVWHFLWVLALKLCKNKNYLPKKKSILTGQDIPINGLNRGLGANFYIPVFNLVRRIHKPDTIFVSFLIQALTSKLFEITYFGWKYPLGNFMKVSNKYIENGFINLWNQTSSFCGKCYIAWQIRLCYISCLTGCCDL